MTVFISVLWVAAGISLFAGVQFLGIGFTRRQERVFLSFGLVCLLLAAYMPLSALWYRAVSVEELAPIARLQMGLICLIYPAIAWFVALYSGARRPWLAAVTAGVPFGIFFIVNLRSPLSFLYSAIAIDRPLLLPWGESLSRFRLEASALAPYYYVASYGVFAWAFYRCLVLWRRGQGAQAWPVAVYLGIQLATVVHAELIDNIHLRSVYLAEFAFLALVVLMSRSLGLEWRQRTVALETSLDELRAETGRRRGAEAALRESEDRLRRSQVYANIGTWDWDIRSGALYWSERVGPLLGYGTAVPETTYENFLRAVHPEDRQRVIDRVNDCVERDRPYEIEHRVMWPDGTIRWMLERGGVTRAVDGAPLRMLGVVQDITERKRAQAELAESEQLFREFAEHMEQVLWVRDLRSDRMIYVNPAYEQVWDRPVGAILQNPADFMESVYPEDRAGVRAALYRQRDGAYFDRKYRILRADGTVRWVHARSFPIRDVAGTVYRIGGFAEDITAAQEAEIKRLERERRQRATLVREVHHRIKNHLQGVIGLLQRRGDLHPEFANTMREAAAQVRSIALVHGLQGHHPATEVLLCELVPTVARSVEETMASRHRIGVVFEMDWSLQLSEEDAVPIALILNELLVNGVKYTPLRPIPGVLQLTIREEQGVGRVRLFCPGARLPADFDFERGVGLGTGLDLVRALLPREGARLHFAGEPDGVSCELELHAPVVTAGSRKPACGGS